MPVRAAVASSAPTLLASVTFEPTVADLSADAEGRLQPVLAHLSTHPTDGIVLMAYAEGPSETPFIARRLSLGRALVVRDYLMKHGIAAERIQVRALGQPAPGIDPNHLDVVTSATTAAPLAH